MKFSMTGQENVTLIQVLLHIVIMVIKTISGSPPFKVLGKKALSIKSFNKIQQNLFPG
jgi:hypothetical protein